MIVSTTGKILYHTEESMLGKPAEELPYYPEMKRNFNIDFPPGVSSFYRENKQMFSFQYVSPQNGLIYYEILPMAEIEAGMMRYQWMVMGVPLLVAALGGCFFILFIRKDSRLSCAEAAAVMEGTGNPDSGQEALDSRGIDMIVRSFYLAVELKDRYTAGHTERVTRYALAIYDQMEEEQKRMLPRDDLRYAGLLHDIGKVAIPDHILLKEGKLTEEEYEEIKRHPTVGADLVEQIENLAHVSPGVRYHHERWDGKGYPERLKGEEIPLVARILAVADTFDAMTSTRSYREALSAQTAYEEIIRCSRTQFDPFVVRLFTQAFQQGKLLAPNMDGGGKTEGRIPCDG
jgi:HD-GYP domain-containing protein (c-di-GMP phosphodiesterase class II)